MTKVEVKCWRCGKHLERFVPDTIEEAFGPIKFWHKVLEFTSTITFRCLKCGQYFSTEEKYPVFVEIS